MSLALIVRYNRIKEQKFPTGFPNLHNLRKLKMATINAKTIQKSLTLLADRFPEFVEKFTKLNNKLGGAFAYSIVPQTRNDKIVFPNPDNPGAYFKVCKPAEFEFAADTFTLELFDIEINGECPHIPGYNLLGTIKDEEVRILHSLQADNPVPDDYRYLPISCDHCNTNHRRVFAFVIQNEEETLSIGRHCFGDFTGSNNNILAAIDNTMLMESLFGSFEFKEGDNEGGSIKYMYDVDAIIAHAWNETQTTKGYIRREQGSLVSAYNTPEAVIYRVTSKKNRVQYTDDDMAKAKVIIEFIKAMPADNEYLKNMQAFMECDCVQYKRIGFVASAVSIWYHHLNSQMNLTPKGESNHIGNVGDKIISIPVKIIATKIVEGMYGNKQMVKMMDNSGNIITWWNSSSTFYDMGFESTIKSAKVKLHDVYNNQKQTTVSHVKFAE